MEGNSILRDEYACTISEFRLFQLVIVDKSAANARVAARQRGWGPKRVGMVNPLPFSKGEKYSFLPALNKEGLLCQDKIQGSFTTEMFFFLIRDILLLYCNPFPGRNSVIVMDNCQIHQHQYIQEIIEEAGCKLVMLPPYSPNYNPIEIAFGLLKTWIARHHMEFAEVIIGDEKDNFFLYGMKAVQVKHAQWFFTKCVYS